MHACIGRDEGFCSKGDLAHNVTGRKHFGYLKITEVS